MHIFITGVAGFIGSHLAEFYLNRGDEVWGIDNLSAGSIKNIQPFKKHPKFKFNEADLLHWKDLQRAINWSNMIYHMAAVVGVKQVLKEPIVVNETNILGTERILKMMKETQSQTIILIASTSSVYGDSAQASSSENDILLIEPPSHISLATYAISKLADEAFALAYCQKNILKAIVVRLFNVIGPRQTGFYGMVAPRFVQQACQNEAITVFGDGKQTRSFCDVRDCINMISQLMMNEKMVGNIINVGHADTISILDLAKLIKERAKSDSEIIFIPYKEAYGVDFQDIHQRIPNVQKCLLATKYRYQWTLIETIDDLINRFRKDLLTEKQSRESSKME